MVIQLDGFEELDHFAVEQLDAAAAGGRSDFVLMIRPVDIDVASVAVVPVALVDPWFEAVQPEDSSRDEVGAKLLSAQLLVAFVDADPPLEYFAQRRPFANSIGDAMQPGWRAAGVLSIRWRVRTGRDSKASFRQAVFE